MDKTRHIRMSSLVSGNTDQHFSSFLNKRMDFSTNFNDYNEYTIKASFGTLVFFSLSLLQIPLSSIDVLMYVLMH